jgi:hypothetical protein
MIYGLSIQSGEFAAGVYSFSLLAVSLAAIALGTIRERRQAALARIKAAQ